MSQQLRAAKYRKYSTDTLNHAVQMIKCKTMSLRQALKSFNIPKTTLSNKVRGKSDIGCRNSPSAVLTKSEEMIADWAVNMAKMDVVDQEPSFWILFKLL